MGNKCEEIQVLRYPYARDTTVTLHHHPGHPLACSQTLLCAGKCIAISSSNYQGHSVRWALLSLFYVGGPTGPTVAQGYEPGSVQLRACIHSHSLEKDDGAAAPYPPYLYHRVQGCLRGARLAVVLHQAGGHEAEAPEQLMGPSARGDAWGICRGGRGM